MTHRNRGAVQPWIVRSTGRRAMTLIEILVTITILTLLVAMLLPALNAARESSRSVACGMNLRQIGVGLSARATTHGKYCSGVFDWLRDGCVTEKGWVADLVRQGTPVGKMLCPSNPARISETFNDLVNAAVPADDCADYRGSPTETAPDGSPVTNPCRAIADLPPGSAARIFIAEKQIYDKHYNTNYTPSWFLVRCAVTLNEWGQLKSDKPATCATSLLSAHSTFGPLSRDLADAAAVPGCFLPLMGCGAPSGALTVDIASLRDTPAVRPMTRGPVLKAAHAFGAALQAPSPPNNTPREGAAGWWAAWNNQTLQDYREFGPVHRGSCNVLFADGSVRNVIDANQDGLLNNGFPGGNGGFTSSVEELLPDEFFSMWSLKAKPPVQMPPNP